MEDFIHLLTSIARPNHRNSDCYLDIRVGDSFLKLVTEDIPDLANVTAVALTAVIFIASRVLFNLINLGEFRTSDGRSLRCSRLSLNHSIGVSETSILVGIFCDFLPSTSHQKDVGRSGFCVNTAYEIPENLQS